MKSYWINSLSEEEKNKFNKLEQNIKKINKPKVVNTKIITKGKLVVTPTYQIKISINNMY